MALSIEYTNQFKKDLKLIKRRKKNLKLLQDIMDKIVNEQELNKKFCDHALAGNWNSHRELHIESDWLLIYKLLLKERVVLFVRTGSHSDLF